jgi:hypothetical protein
VTDAPGTVTPAPDGVTDAPTGVWLVGTRDYYWDAEIVFPGTTEGELAALRVVNERGYGEAKFVEFGQEGQIR